MIGVLLLCTTAKEIESGETVYSRTKAIDETCDASQECLSGCCRFGQCQQTGVCSNISRSVIAAALIGLILVGFVGYAAAKVLFRRKPVVPVDVTPSDPSRSFLEVEYEDAVSNEEA